MYTFRLNYDPEVVAVEIWRQFVLMVGGQNWSHWWDFYCDLNSIIRAVKNREKTFYICTDQASGQTYHFTGDKFKDAQNDTDIVMSIVEDGFLYDYIVKIAFDWPNNVAELSFVDVEI